MSQTVDESLPADPRSISRWRAFVGNAAFAATTALSLPAIAAFAGRSWWVLELASHFRIQYFWGLLIGTALLIVGGRRRSAAAFAPLLVVHAVILWPFYSPPHGGNITAKSLRVASINLLMQNSHHAEVLNFVRDTSPDIVLFLEVDPVWGRVLQELAVDWPYSHTRPQRNNFGIAIFSRIPLDPLEIEPLGRNYPALIAQLEVEGTPITLLGMHPMSPMTRERHEFRDWQLRRAGELIAESSGEKLLMGDLNCTSWSPAFHDLVARSALGDSRLGRGAQPSWPTGLPSLMRIPIDHCLVSPGLEVVDRWTGPDIGSDHLPIVVDLAVKSPIVKARTP